MFIKDVKSSIVTTINNELISDSYENVKVISSIIPSDKEELKKFKNTHLTGNAAIIVSYLGKPYSRDRGPHYTTNPQLLITILSRTYNDDSNSANYKYDIENMIDKLSDIIFKTKGLELLRDMATPISVNNSYEGRIFIEQNKAFTGGL